MAAPSSTPVSIDEAKVFLSVDHSDHDTLISSFIAAGVSRGEATTGTRFAEQTVQLWADHWSDLEILPIGPVSAVTDITFQDREGSEQTVPSEDYELVGAGLSRSLRPSSGSGWPSDVLDETGAIGVTMTVGYSELPPSLVAAVLLMTGDLSAHRETASVGMPAGEIPMSMQVDTLLSQYRIWL